MRFTQKDIDRFWSHVDKSGDCWIWTAHRVNGTYGSFSVNGKEILSHRFSYEIENGNIPNGMFICHQCDNPPCVRPSHLFVANRLENMRDMQSKGRARFQKCPEAIRGENCNFSKLTSDDVRKIRQLRASGMLLRELSEMFGVTMANISDIARRVIWKHI